MSNPFKGIDPEIDKMIDEAEAPKPQDNESADQAIKDLLINLIGEVNKWSMYVPSAEAEAEVHKASTQLQALTDSRLSVVEEIAYRSGLTDGHADVERAAAQARFQEVVRLVEMTRNQSYEDYLKQRLYELESALTDTKDAT